MQETNILKIKSPKQTVWNVLSQVPGLSETLIAKICTIFQIKRNIKIEALTEDKIKEIEQYVMQNFLVGYKLIRKITQATTLRFISRSRRGIRSRKGLPINGQRTHSNGKTPRRLRGHWVLPEVLRNPIAYFNFNKTNNGKRNY
jgi:small subunit ribosomal protein S13